MYLQGVTAVDLPVDHVHDGVFDGKALTVSGCPVITGPASISRDKDVVGIVDGPVGGLHDRVDDTGFQVQHDASRSKVRTIRLIKECTGTGESGWIGGRKSGAICLDSVLIAKLFPKLAANYTHPNEHALLNYAAAYLGFRTGQLAK